MKLLGVSTQLYVWSQLNEKKSFADILNEISNAGYDGAETNLSEIANKEKAKEADKLFKKFCLKPSSFYSGGTFHEASLAMATVSDILKMSEFAVELGAPSITVNPNSKAGGAEKTDDELKIQAEYLNKLGEGLKIKEISLVLHNHTPEIVNNAREFRSYCDLTDPEFVNVCIDTHWVYRGGVDPFELTKEYGSRIKAMHLRNSKDGVWSEDFGDGDIDYVAYRDLLEKINYEGWITVELAYEGQTKITRSIQENIRRSRDYVRNVFGV
jgi:inosose dehydratase